MAEAAYSVQHAGLPSEDELYELPAIDMKDGDESNLVRQIYEQMTTIGFLQLKNVEGFDESRLLADIVEFHGMPESEKRKLYTQQFNAENPNRFKGFYPFLDNDASHKEFFDMGPPIEEADELERTKYFLSLIHI